MEPSVEQCVAWLANGHAYEQSLRSTEFPATLLANVDPTNDRVMQQIRLILLHMISFDVPPIASASTRSVFKQASEWAADTLLDLNLPQHELLMDVIALQTLPNAVVTSHTRSVLHSNLHNMLVLQDVQLEPETLTATLEHAALHLDEVSAFLELTEQLVAGHEVFSLGPEAIQRLCGQQRLLHALSMASRVRIWANHVPLWTAQLEEWLLGAHASPFQSLASIVAISPDSSLLRRHSHLYILMLQWFHQHSGLLTCSRTAELLSYASRCLRGPTGHRTCQRSLLNQVTMDPDEHWTPTRRALVLKPLAQSVTQLKESKTIDRSTLVFEWMGLLERPYLLQEAIASLFSPADNSRADAALVVGWHYSFSHEESADALAAIALETASGLDASDGKQSNLWLQRHRSEFATTARLRLKLVWFWLVCCSKAESDEQEIEDTLKSVEYVFRRFAPSDRKRTFQVDVVAQFLQDIDWRWQQNQQKTLQLNVALAWLQKIVHMMQVEHKTSAEEPTQSIELDQLNQRLHGLLNHS